MGHVWDVTHKVLPAARMCGTNKEDTCPPQCLPSALMAHYVGPTAQLVDYTIECSELLIYLSLRSGELDKTSSHMWDNCYFPMFLFRDGSLTLVCMVPFMDLARLCH